MPKKTTDQFKREVYGVVGDEYTVLGEYVSAKTCLWQTNYVAFGNQFM